MNAVLPDLDVWVKAFSRQEPDPLVVHAFAALVRSRRVFLFGAVRQRLLERTRDPRQLTRLTWVLSAIPDVPVNPKDHVRAATLAQRLRGGGQGIGSWQALAWTVAERMQASLWSTARGWQLLVAHGCPVKATMVTTTG